MYTDAPSYGAVPVPHVPVHIAWDTLDAHKYTYCASSLQNNALPQDLYSPLSVSVE